MIARAASLPPPLPMRGRGDALDQPSAARPRAPHAESAAPAPLWGRRGGGLPSPPEPRVARRFRAGKTRLAPVAAFALLCLFGGAPVAIAGNVVALSRDVCATPFLTGQPARPSGLQPVAAAPDPEPLSGEDGPPLQQFQDLDAQWLVTLAGDDSICSITSLDPAPPPGLSGPLARMLRATGYRDLPPCPEPEPGVTNLQFLGPEHPGTGLTTVVTLSEAQGDFLTLVFVPVPSNLIAPDCSAAEEP